MDRGSICFFDVQQCGFYSSKEKKAVHEEGNMKEVLGSFFDWVKGRDFRATIPWSPEDYPKRQEIYCKSIAVDSKTDDALVVFWKRYGNDSGKVTGISHNAKVGSNADDSVTIGTEVGGGNAFLGQPMYYWFIPEHNVIATINFSHSSAMTQDVCDYLKRCLDFRIDHPRKVVKEGAHATTGEPMMAKYISYKSADGKRTMRSRFFVLTKKLDSEESNAKKLAMRITHLVVRDTISSSVSVEKDSIFKLWSKVKDKTKFKTKVEIIEEAKLSANEVTAVMALHNQEYDLKNKWNNVGFREKGSDATRWFSQYVSREQIELDSLTEKHNYYSAEKMLETLQKNRNDLLLQVSQGEPDSTSSTTGG